MTYIHIIYHKENIGTPWESQKINYFCVQWLGSTIVIENNSNLPCGITRLVRASSQYTKVVGSIQKSSNECVNKWNNKNQSLPFFLCLPFFNQFFLKKE